MQFVSLQCTHFPRVCIVFTYSWPIAPPRTASVLHRSIRCWLFIFSKRIAARIFVSNVCKFQTQIANE